jgi:hypothetical protein
VKDKIKSGIVVIAAINNDKLTFLAVLQKILQIDFLQIKLQRDNKNNRWWWWWQSRVCPSWWQRD